MDLNLSHLHATLEETFAANFIAYYRAHVAHLNIVGRMFTEDHKLLQKIYEDLFDEVDTLGEIMRSTRAFVPSNLQTVVGISPLADEDVTGKADDMLSQVEESMDILIDQYHALYDAAEEARYIDVSNHAQDRIGKLAKFRWMLEATLEEREDDDEDDMY